MPVMGWAGLGTVVLDGMEALVTVGVVDGFRGLLMEEEEEWAWVCDGIAVPALGTEEDVVVGFVGRRGVRERVIAWILRRRDSGEERC